MLASGQHLDLLAAAIAYNGMSIDEGFEAFDEDQDGVISLEELRVRLYRTFTYKRSFHTSPYYC